VPYPTLFRSGGSASLGALPREREEPGGAVDPTIVSYRPVPSTKLEFDPVTGRPVLADSEADPLAGEVFDTDEFQSSQEFVDMGGSVDDAETAAATAGSDDQQGSGRT